MFHCFSISCSSLRLFGGMKPPYCLLHDPGPRQGELGSAGAAPIPRGQLRPHDYTTPALRGAGAAVCK